MMDDGSDCIKVLTQLKAVRSAVSGVMDKIIDEQFESCMASVKKQDKELILKIKNYV